MRETFGRFLEDFHPGDLYRHWPGKTITESDNNLFSLLTMNHHPVHLDSLYCQGQAHGKVLVVGTLVISVVVGMTVSEISGKAIANLEFEKIKHDSPVFIGDTIYAETEILECSKFQFKTRPRCDLCRNKGLQSAEGKSPDAAATRFDSKQGGMQWIKILFSEV